MISEGTARVVVRQDTSGLRASDALQLGSPGPRVVCPGGDHVGMVVPLGVGRGHREKQALRIRFAEFVARTLDKRKR